MDVLEAIRNAGVVGAGGAGFPTHVKLNVNAQRVIVNGAECEPLLRVDQLSMQREADKLVRGLELAMEAAHASDGVIATKTHYEDAVEALDSLEIDEYGLDYMDRKILKVLIEHYRGGPAGLRAIAAAVGIEADTISEVYEPFLIQTGFLIRTPRGREVTGKACQHMGYPMVRSTNQSSLFEDTSS